MKHIQDKTDAPDALALAAAFCITLETRYWPYTDDKELQGVILNESRRDQYKRARGFLQQSIKKMK